MQLVRISSDESLLLFVAPALDLMFSLECLSNPIIKFAVDKLDWQSFGSISGPQTLLMLP